MPRLVLPRMQSVGTVTDKPMLNAGSVATRRSWAAAALAFCMSVALGAWSPAADAAPGESKQYDSSGRYLGRTDKDGKVYDASGRYQGRTDKDGKMYDASGRYTGRVDDDGRRYDSSGRYQGRSDKDGKIYDASGRYEGRVGADGRQYDASGRYEGRADDQKPAAASSSTSNSGSTSNSSSASRDVTRQPAGANAVQVENHRQIAPGVFCRDGDAGCAKGRD